MRLMRLRCALYTHWWSTLFTSRLYIKKRNLKWVASLCDFTLWVINGLLCFVHAWRSSQQISAVRKAFVEFLKLQEVFEDKNKTPLRVPGLLSLLNSIHTCILCVHRQTMHVYALNRAEARIDMHVHACRFSQAHRVSLSFPGDWNSSIFPPFSGKYIMYSFDVWFAACRSRCMRRMPMHLEAKGF